MRLLSSIVLGRVEKDGSFIVQHMMNRPPLTILACFSIFFLCLMQYCRHANYRDPTSYFFDPAHAYERIYSAVRIKEADAFVESAELLPRPRTTGDPLSMCIGVTTVARSGEQYVRRTMGSLLEGISEEQRRTLYVTILIGHAEPSKHPIANEVWIEHLANKVLKYKKEDIPRIHAWEEGGLYRNKTIFDYTYLLNDCYATGAKYIAMIEDDTLAVEGWYPRALEALSNVENEMERRSRVIAKKAQNEVESPPPLHWMYLRLFYVEDLFGWNSENWPTYLFWSFATWAMLTSSVVFGRTKVTSRTAQAFLSNPGVLVISGFCIPLLIGLFFASGRNSVMPLAPGIHEMNKFGCCSQGYVFPRDMVPPLLEWTNLDRDWLVDMMIEQISNMQGWIRWAESPALLQHIGTTSSKGVGFDKTARQLWNSGFELYRKSRLGKSNG